MKRFLTLIFALLLTVCFASCGGQSAGAKDLDNIKEAGVIRIGMECNYKPFNWTQNTSDNGAVKIVKPDTGKYAYGYDVMIAKKIAEALGVKLDTAGRYPIKIFNFMGAGQRSWSILHNSCFNIGPSQI